MPKINLLSLSSAQRPIIWQRIQSEQPDLAELLRSDGMKLLRESRLFVAISVELTEQVINSSHFELLTMNHD